MQVPPHHQNRYHHPYRTRELLPCFLDLIEYQYFQKQAGAYRHKISLQLPRP